MGKNLLAKFLFFLSLTSFLIIFYRRNEVSGIYNFNDLYFLVPIFFFGLSIASVFLPKIIKFYFFYSLSAILISIYSLEIIFFFQSGKNIEKKKVEYFKKNKLDYRKRFEVYDNILKRNLNETLTVPPQNFLKKNYPLFPLSGISQKKTIMCNESGYYNNYISDRFGFNNDDKVYEKKDIHSVFIGDSFLHGACVNNVNNLISNLRSTKFFNEKNILNLGYGGNGPLINLATLREYFPKNKNVKYLFWIYYEGNDLKELNNELASETLLKYLKNSTYSQSLKKKQKEINNYVFDLLNNNEKIDDETNFLSLKIIISILGIDRTRGLIFSKFDPKYKKNVEILNSFKKIAQEIHIYSKYFKTELVFVYIPSSFKSEGKNYYEDVLNIIIDNKIKFLDLTNVKFIYDKNMYPKFGAHFNEKGYKALSDEISLFMIKNN